METRELPTTTLLVDEDDDGNIPTDVKSRRTIPAAVFPSIDPRGSLGCQALSFLKEEKNKKEG